MDEIVSGSENKQAVDSLPIILNAVSEKSETQYKNGIVGKVVSLPTLPAMVLPTIKIIKKFSVELFDNGQGVTLPTLACSIAHLLRQSSLGDRECFGICPSYNAWGYSQLWDGMHFYNTTSFECIAKPVEQPKLMFYGIVAKPSFGIVAKLGILATIPLVRWQVLLNRRTIGILNTPRGLFTMPKLRLFNNFWDSPGCTGTRHIPGFENNGRLYRPNSKGVS